MLKINVSSTFAVIAIITAGDCTLQCYNFCKILLCSKCSLKLSPINLLKIFEKHSNNILLRMILCNKYRYNKMDISQNKNHALLRAQ